MSTGATPTTETPHGTAATTVPHGLAPPITLPREPMREAHRSLLPTALEVLVKHTTRLLALTRVVHRLQVPTEERQLVKRTTHTPEPLQPRVKPLTPTEAMEAQPFQRTARPRTRSIRLPRKVLRAECRLRRAAELLPRRAQTAALPRAEQQAATSMRQQTGMSTRTPEAAGIRPRGPLTRDPLQRTQELTLLPPAAMEHRKGAAGHRRLAEAEAEMVGNPDRLALVVRRAAAAG